MAVGQVTKYNQLETILFGTGNRPWNDATVGSCMFMLAKATYTPSKTHLTVADIGTAGVDYISAGDGSPIAVSSPTIDKTTNVGESLFKSADANFGASVSCSGKYLVCVQPVTANVFASTAKLLWYVDLNTATSASEVQAASAEFKVVMPTLGWFRTV